MALVCFFLVPLPVRTIVYSVKRSELHRLLSHIIASPSYHCQLVTSGLPKIWFEYISLWTFCNAAPFGTDPDAEHPCDPSASSSGCVTQAAQSWYFVNYWQKSWPDCSKDHLVEFRQKTSHIHLTTYWKVNDNTLGWQYIGIRLCSFREAHCHSKAQPLQKHSPNRWRLGWEFRKTDTHGDGE